MTLNRYMVSALAFVSGAGLSGCNSQPTITATKEKPSVQVVQLANSQKIKQQKFTGRLASAETASIAFRVPGLIHEILVQPGDSVKAGQIIARLDPHDYQVTIRELDARLAEAQAAFTLAGIELKRVEKAVNDDAISSVSLDRAQSGFARAKAMVDVVTQNQQRAKDSLAYTELKAPFDGMIARNNLETFEQVTPGLPIFTLHKPDQIEVMIDVPENRIDQFSKSAQATVSWFQAEHPLLATLTEIETLPDPIKQTYTVTYKVDTRWVAPAKILPGKSVTVTTQLETANNAFCVPYSAVQGNLNSHYVFRVSQQKNNHKTAEEVPVTIDEFQEDTVCVKGDLTADELVIVAGGSYLQSGDSIGELHVRNRGGVSL